MSDVELTIDEQTVRVTAGTSLWDAALSVGIEIPVLCHDPKLEPVGVCRMCAVEVEGERAMTASCVREAEQGMVVRTAGAKIERCRDVLTELLLSEQPESSARETTTADDQLLALAAQRDVRSRLPGPSSPDARGDDVSSPVIAVDRSLNK